MPRRKPGLHKDLSDILEGARIPEEARMRRTDGENPPPRSPEMENIRARAADNLVPPGPECTGPRWVFGDEGKPPEKKRRGLFGVLKRIGRLMAGSESDSESE